MSGCSSYKRIYRDVAQEINSPVFKLQFKKFHCKHPAFRLFPSPEDFLAFLNVSQSNNYDLIDSLFLSLVVEIHREETLFQPAWSLLLAAFKPGLTLIYYRHYTALKFFSEPFSEVYWAFLQTVDSWPPEKKDKVAANLLLNTAKKVKARIKEEILLRENTEKLIENQLPGQQIPTNNLKFDLDWLVRRKIITEEDALILKDRLMYDRQLSELANKLKINYKAACKRYDRALAKMAGFYR